MKKTLFYNFLFSLVLFSCAQEPSAVVSEGQAVNGGDSLVSSDSVIVNAVTYTGRNIFTRQSCTVDLSIVEENGSHVYLLNVDQNVHGAALPATEANMYRFDFATNTYSDAETGRGDLALAGAILRDGSKADINNLLNDEIATTLEYSIRIETTAPSAETFEEALEEVVANPSELANHRADLDYFDRVIFKIFHGGHYDSSGCERMVPTGVRQVEFNVSHSDDHDDDDHDDHDDDHDDHDHD